MANNNNNNKNGLPLRVLSLDGDGARGVVQLQVLERIFNTEELKQVKPCDFFDLIVGTSTGGIVAVLLGRLELTVAEAMQVYSDLTPIIFSRKIFQKARIPHYDDQVLEREIKTILRNHGLDAETATLASEFNKCDIALVARRGQAADGPIKVFRSYDVPFQGNDARTVPIWQAVRATSAAPTFFKSMVIDNIHYVDGGLGYNNPSLVAMNEAKQRFPDKKIGILYSIGTGVSKYADAVVNKWSDLIGFTTQQLPNMLTSTRQAHEAAFEQCEEKDIPYFRFDPPFAGDLPLDTPDMGKLNAYTQSYLDEAEQFARLKRSDKVSAQLNYGQVETALAK